MKAVSFVSQPKRTQRLYIDRRNEHIGLALRRAALLTGVLNGRLKEWFCWPAALVRRSICHLAPCQLSQHGLPSVDNLLPYVCLHQLTQSGFSKNKHQIIILLNTAAESVLLLHSHRVGYSEASIYVAFQHRLFMQRIKSTV